MVQRSIDLYLQMVMGCVAKVKGHRISVFFRYFLSGTNFGSESLAKNLLNEYIYKALSLLGGNYICLYTCIYNIFINHKYQGGLKMEIGEQPVERKGDEIHLKFSHPARYQFSALYIILF